MHSNTLEDALFVRNFLLLETLFTRSKSDDISLGIQIATNLLKFHKNDREKVNAILSMLSILCRQQATLCAISGDYARAYRFQKVSARYYRMFHPGVMDATGRKKDIEKLLRYYSTIARYSQVDLPSSTLEEAFKIISDMDAFSSTTHLSYLIDSLRLQEHISPRLFDAVYVKVSRVLETEGYGSRNDRAKMVTLRRRWWQLHLAADDSASIEMFDQDVKMWAEIHMCNEIRELYDSLAKKKCNLPKWKRNHVFTALEKHLRKREVTGAGIF